LVPERSASANPLSYETARSGAYVVNSGPRLVMAWGCKPSSGMAMPPSCRGSAAAHSLTK